MASEGDLPIAGAGDLQAVSTRIHLYLRKRTYHVNIQIVAEIVLYVECERLHRRFV
jgi:hypothetical protein